MGDQKVRKQQDGTVLSLIPPEFFLLLLYAVMVLQKPVVTAPLFISIVTYA